MTERQTDPATSHLVSVVVPVYGCAGTLQELVREVSAAFAATAYEHEMILVDDGSRDEAWRVIQELVSATPKLRGIQLTRNFGQHEAITAGLEAARGDWLVVMDCDLQDSPAEIPRLLEHAVQGSWDAVFAARRERQDSVLKRVTSRAFYAVLSYMTDTRLNPEIANFGVYHRSVIDAVLQMHESLRFFPLLVRWVGFRSTTLAVKHRSRDSGKSAYSLRRLLRLATNIIITFSDKPLRLMVAVGFGISALAVLYAAYTAVRVLVHGAVVPGWASVVVSVWFLGGFLTMMLGILGIYVGRTFDEVKRRPVYLVRKAVAHEGTDDT